jgi:serine O-acetyltransferase
MHYLLFWLLSFLARRAGEAEALDADILRWQEILRMPADMGPARRLCHLFERLEFRSLYYYRVRGVSGLRKIVLKVVRVFLPPLAGLHLACPKIGPGLFLQHGFSTIIAAGEIGRNCWINQQVTIGFSDVASRPVLGDDVSIGAGAILVGGITIGNGAVIGAGTTVTKSVPAGVTVVSARARIVKRNGVRVDELL